MSKPETSVKLRFHQRISKQTEDLQVPIGHAYLIQCWKITGIWIDVARKLIRKSPETKGVMVDWLADIIPRCPVVNLKTIKTPNGPNLLLVPYSLLPRYPKLLIISLVLTVVLLCMFCLFETPN